MADPAPHEFLRFIPAWAGNTGGQVRWSFCAPVHPRVGGEHASVNPAGISCSGSSPRGRGTRTGGIRLGGFRRFIPAWAGNTLRSDIRCTVTAVHPRVGGEHAPPPALSSTYFGSSPRGRGTPCRTPTRPEWFRFIPAWAGNTSISFAFLIAMSVHPRVGGEHPRVAIGSRYVHGSSPRGRGTLCWPSPGNGRCRFIPAWAGNTHYFRRSSHSNTVHPRVGGEHFFP